VTRTTSFIAGFVGVSALAMLAIAEERVAMPNPSLTPGAVATDDLSEICVAGYAAAHRMPFGSPEERLRYRYVMKAYGIGRNDWHLYVLDHLQPLELGGADKIINLWPQPKDEAHQKDILENEMRRQVCADERTLPDARRQMLSGAW
jgi:hypothetical protein